MLLADINFHDAHGIWPYGAKVTSSFENGDEWAFRYVRHAANCQCSYRAKKSYDWHIYDNITQKEIAERLEISHSRVHQLIKRVIACKSRSWVPAAHINDEMAARYLIQICAGLIDAVEERKANNVP